MLREEVKVVDLPTSGTPYYINILKIGLKYYCNGSSEMKK